MQVLITVIGKVIITGQQGVITNTCCYVILAKASIIFRYATLRYRCYPICPLRSLASLAHSLGVNPKGANGGS